MFPAPLFAPVSESRTEPSRKYSLNILLEWLPLPLLSVTRTAFALLLEFGGFAQLLPSTLHAVWSTPGA